MGIGFSPLFLVPLRGWAPSAVPSFEIGPPNQENRTLTASRFFPPRHPSIFLARGRYNSSVWNSYDHAPPSFFAVLGSAFGRSAVWLGTRWTPPPLLA